MQRLNLHHHSVQKIILIAGMWLCVGMGQVNASVQDVDLGEAAAFAVFNVTGKLQMSNPQTTINGTLAAGEDSNQNVSGGNVTGDYNAHTSCTGCTTLSGLDGSFNQNPATDMLLEQAALDMMNARTAIEGLTGTQSLVSITGNTTINSDQKFNVIDIASISLTGSETITLNGSADDYFFVRLGGDLKLTGSSSILLGGGLTAATVIFLVATDMNVGDVTQTGSSELFGTYLVNGKYSSSGSTLTGSVMAMGMDSAETIVLTSGATVNYVGFQAPVPVPAAVWLMGTALGLMGGIARRRPQNA